MDWEAALALTETTCAEIFDRTPCRLQPRAIGQSVNHPAGNDPGRVAFDFLGTIELEPPSDRLARHLSSDPGIQNGTVSYDAVLTALTVGWLFRPKRDDRIISGNVTWKVAASEDDGSMRGAWYLVKER